ncbi:hypothetical protein C8R44DRAFT_777028 [Mycena epipterygia]|nr:hypothetical protein C8R44DRAFT_777028 [Mycena epipterygia]
MSASSSAPRRRTLCTDDGSDIVPPQLPFYPPSSSSRHTAPGPMTIDVQLADRGQKIRPLPRIPIPPTPKSAPPLPHRPLSRSPSMRPLPCLPDSGAAASGALAISVTPATPMSPHRPALESSTHLSAPCPRPGPPRFASLSLNLQTSPDALAPRAFESSTPATPTLPEPPSPATAQRKRIHKLRRHLGESVQLQLVLDRPDTRLDVLAELRHRDHHAKHDAYPIETRVLDSDDSDESQSDYDDGRESGYSWDMIVPASARVPPESQKWVRERGKQRWTEDNFSKVLRDLRAL